MFVEISAVPASCFVASRKCKRRLVAPALAWVVPLEKQVHFRACSASYSPYFESRA